MFNKVFHENGATYEKVWKNMAEPERPQTTIKYVACRLCWATKATDTHIQNM
jgi:hypothetical protein